MVSALITWLISADRVIQNISVSKPAGSGRLFTMGWSHAANLTWQKEYAHLPELSTALYKQIPRVKITVHYPLGSPLQGEHKDGEPLAVSSPCNNMEANQNGKQIQVWSSQCDPIPLRLDSLCTSVVYHH